MEYVYKQPSWNDPFGYPYSYTWSIDPFFNYTPLGGLRIERTNTFLVLCNRDESIALDHIKTLNIWGSIVMRKRLYKLYISIHKRHIYNNIRRIIYAKRMEKVHIDIQSKPSNHIGSSVPGILYEKDMMSELLQGN